MAMMADISMVHYAIDTRAPTGTDGRVTVSAIKHINLAALHTQLNQYVFNI